MKSIIFLLLTSASLLCNAQTIEDKVLIEMQTSFNDNSINFAELSRSYEKALIKSGKLEDTTTAAWTDLLFELCKNGVIGHVMPESIEVIEMEFDLSLQHFANAIQKVSVQDSISYAQSNIRKFVERYPQALRNPEPALTYLWQSIQTTPGSLRGHPLFKQLVMLIVANFSDIVNNTSDQMIVTESDYSRWVMANGGSVPQIEKRNVCEINMNALGQIMIRGEIVDTLANIKPIVKKFLTYNYSLNEAETRFVLQDPNYVGFNFPFFSHISDTELNDNILEITAQLDTIDASETVRRAMMWRRQQWIRKKHFLHTSKKTHLKEIHTQAHFRIETGGNQEHANELLVPLLQVIVAIRNDLSVELFGESFEKISERNNFLMNDHYKLRYLENQCPLYLFINPVRAMGTPPPAVEMPPPPKSE